MSSPLRRAGRVVVEKSHTPYRPRPVPTGYVGTPVRLCGQPITSPARHGQDLELFLSPFLVPRLKYC